MEDIFPEAERALPFGGGRGSVTLSHPGLLVTSEPGQHPSGSEKAFRSQDWPWRLSPDRPGGWGAAGA